MEAPYQLVGGIGAVLAAAAMAAALPRRASQAVTLASISLMLLLVLKLPVGSVYSHQGLDVAHVVGGYKAAGVLLLAAELLVLLSLVGELDNRRAPLVILAAAGGLLVLYSESFITLIAGLETAAAALAALYSMGGSRAGEAAVKYFYSSMLGVAFIVLGAALLYGNGVRGFTDLGAVLGNGQHMALQQLLGLVFLVAGLALEVGLAPFYMWLPDVVQGAHILGVATALLLLDAPAMLALLRLVVGAGAAAGGVTAALLVLALASMLVGEFSALAQSDMRRMLGYSIVGGAGYKVLLAVALALSGMDGMAALVYLVTAGSMSAALVAASQRYTGTLGGKAAETVGLLSLAGLPPLYGFAAKLSMLVALVSAGYAWMAGVAALFFLVAAAYIARYIALSGPVARNGGGLQLAPLLVYSFLLLVLGVWPQIVQALEVASR